MTEPDPVPVDPFAGTVQNETFTAIGEAVADDAGVMRVPALPADLTLDPVADS